jgi:cytochrome c551/c552
VLRGSIRMVVLTVLGLVSLGAHAEAAAQGPQMHMRGPMRGMMGRDANQEPLKVPPAFERHGCGACHSIDKGGVGPALAWVAWRRPGRGPRAVERLARFIEHGGSGRWGDTAMPDLDVAPSDADALARWILSLPPKAPPGAAPGER